MSIIPADEKVFMVSNGTNTTYGGSAALKAMQQWYTMEDVANTVQPYKVFTGLLTQSGGDNPDTIGGNGGTLDAGYTYLIIDNPDNYDLTLYGAPNNLPGTYFICTNSILNLPYSSSLQIGVNYGAPVATVLENTIGNVWFTYDGVGNYIANSNGLFTVNKSWTPTIQIFNDTAGLRDGEVCEIRYGTSNEYYIATYDQSGAPIDSKLSNTPIEIRVYN